MKTGLVLVAFPNQQKDVALTNTYLFLKSIIFKFSIKILIELQHVRINLEYLALQTELTAGSGCSTT
jgi:hypothetical protein